MGSEKETGGERGAFEAVGQSMLKPFLLSFSSSTPRQKHTPALRAHAINLACGSFDF